MLFSTILGLIVPASAQIKNNRLVGADYTMAHADDTTMVTSDDIADAISQVKEAASQAEDKVSTGSAEDTLKSIYKQHIEQLENDIISILNTTDYSKTTALAFASTEQSYIAAISNSATPDDWTTAYSNIQTAINTEIQKLNDNTNITADQRATDIQPSLL